MVSVFIHFWLLLSQSILHLVTPNSFLMKLNIYLISNQRLFGLNLIPQQSFLLIVGEYPVPSGHHLKPDPSRLLQPVLLLPISVLLLPVGGPSNEQWGVGRPYWMGCQRSLAMLLQGLLHLVTLSS